MIKKDDRTTEQRESHKWGVAARDKFMSGWGMAKAGVSRCAWACAPDADIVLLEQWVRSRSEMRNVSVVDLNKYRPSCAHYHIYVCDRDHPSQRQGT